MKSFGFSSRLFGLDIGDLSFKIVFLKKKGKEIVLESAKEKIVPKGYFLKGEIKEGEKIVNLLREFIRELKLPTPYLVAVLPETKTFIKLIEVLAEENLLEKVKREIELCVPFRLEEVYFDWQIFSQEGRKKKVLIGVAPKTIVDSYLDILKKAGVKPAVLEIESMSILRALVGKEKDKNSNQPKVILDLGATRSSLIIVEEGLIQLTISLPFSGENLTENISSELKIDFAEAERIKREYGKKDKNSQLEKVISSFLENLSQALKTHLSFYEEGVGKKIKEIILCGGGANLFNLVPFLAEKLKIKVSKGNPWINIIKKDEKPPLSEDLSLIYTTAIGLALRGLEEKI